MVLAAAATVLVLQLRGYPPLLLHITAAVEVEVVLKLVIMAVTAQMVLLSFDILLRQPIVQIII